MTGVQTCALPILADGAIHEQGTPDEILKNPRQERTRAFLAGHHQFSF